MIYGRRLFDKGLEGPAQRKPLLRIFRVIHSDFQWKYTWYFNLFLLGALLLFLGPSWYFISQNYDFIIKVAARTSPQLIEHLDRELQWLMGFTLFSFIALLSLCTWVTLKMTGQIIGPLVSMERHMWKLTTGDWSASDFRTRADDDFRELADAYSYLYRSLKAQAEEELRLLEQINVDNTHKDSFNSLNALLELKKAQLNFNRPAPRSLSIESLPVPVTGEHRQAS